MPLSLLNTITAEDPKLRNQPLERLCQRSSLAELLQACDELDLFRRSSDNLYERVRALFFLSAIHRYHLPEKLPAASYGLVPFPVTSICCTAGSTKPSRSSCPRRRTGELPIRCPAPWPSRITNWGSRRWPTRCGAASVPCAAINGCSASGIPATTRCGSARTDGAGPEQRPVSLSCGSGRPCAWTSRTAAGATFFSSAWISPKALASLTFRWTWPCSVAMRLLVRRSKCFLRVIDEPVLRLVSVDLKARADIRSLREVFDFARDYLGLIKAGIIAAGIIPPGLEGSQQELQDVLGGLLGPGKGLEVVSKVNDIPKGSRLAVSTTLLAAIIAVCMRATGQVSSLTGQLAEPNGGSWRPAPFSVNGSAVQAEAGRTREASGRASR